MFDRKNMIKKTAKIVTRRKKRKKEKAWQDE